MKRLLAPGSEIRGEEKLDDASILDDGCKSPIQTTSGRNVWDAAVEVLLNPDQESIDRGYEEGRLAGLQSGYDEGYRIGKTNAMEIGALLGFIIGCCYAINARIEKELSGANESDEKRKTDGVENLGTQKLTEASSLRISRISQTLKLLMTLIEDFPSPSILFEKRESLSPQVRDERLHDLDITARLQEIKSKFKLLTAQINMTDLSLKSIVEEICAGRIVPANAGVSSGEKSLSSHNDPIQGTDDKAKASGDW